MAFALRIQPYHVRACVASRLELTRELGDDVEAARRGGRRERVGQREFNRVEFLERIAGNGHHRLFGVLHASRACGESRGSRLPSSRTRLAVPSRPVSVGSMVGRFVYFDYCTCFDEELC